MILRAESADRSWLLESHEHRHLHTKDPEDPARSSACNDALRGDELRPEEALLCALLALLFRTLLSCFFTARPWIGEVL